MDDSEAMRRVKAGDTDAFGCIVERYHRHLLNFIYTITLDRSRVEDIGQEVFLAAYEKIGRFDEGRGTPFSAWLFAIARNRCISELRRRKRALQVPIDDAGQLPDRSAPGDALVLDAERRRIFEESLALLPDPFRRVFIDSLDGKNIRAIAAAHRISPGTVKSRLSRARQRLREFISARYGDPDHGTF